MCLLVFAWQTHPEYPLVFAGNRDELHARPASVAGFWEDAPRVLGGRDLEAGGTWLGITTTGRFAVVTNYREGPAPKKGPHSRGALTADFLRGDMPPWDHVKTLQQHAQEYAPFSLVVGDRDSCAYFSNRGSAPAAVPPGVHGLSNHLLDTSWPKVTRSKARLEMLLEQGTVTTGLLFKLLADRTPAERAMLPDTGLDTEHEQLLSAPFVVNPVYGTRCSTVIFLHHDGSMRFTERRFDAAGQLLETRYFRISGDPA